MMSTYYNLKLGLQSKPKLVTLDQLQKLSISQEKDAYISIFRYNEEQKKRIEETGSVAGIKDVVTDTLVWDFDNKNNPDQARQDVVELANRLVEKYNIDPDQIQTYYSGSKGFHVFLPISNVVNPDEFKKATNELAKDLSTFDTVVSDPNRIIRLEYTKHPISGLYKIPLHIAEVDELTLDEIREMAKNPDKDVVFNTTPVTLPKQLFVTEKKKTESLYSEEDYSYKNPPKGWKEYKWALAQGWFEEGERHNALMVIAATCRGLGYSKEHTYYMCKAALKKQAARTGAEEFDKTELWENIIEQSVFSDSWQGGQYSPDNNPWLAKYCLRMKFDIKPEKTDAPVVNLDDLITQFIDYSTNFEQNLIKTGIPELDENLVLSTSTLNGLLGQPGSGKTTVALEVLRNSSKNGIPSMFFSLDMGPPLVFSKLVQKESGTDFKSALKLYRENKTRRDEVSRLIKENYKNVGFNFRCGVTVADIRNAIEEQRQNTGVKPKLIVVDYLENIAGPYSDPTANAAMITNQLKDMATELEVCILLLLQTQKHSTPDISDPLLSMKQIKGSSSIEQNCSVVLTLWREGYNPNHVQNDKYISLALVKNRFGSLWRGDFSWEPIRGHIRSLTEEERSDFEDFKKAKKQERAMAESEDNKWS